MTRQEFSDGLTTMLNSYNTQSQFGEEVSKMEIVLDEYEKSVLLTQAQDIVVKSYFDGTVNPQGQGFDNTMRRQIDFSSLIEVATLEPLDPQPETIYDTRGIIFKLPLLENTDNTCKVLFVLNEKLDCYEAVTGKTEVSGSKGSDDSEDVAKDGKWTIVLRNYIVVPINHREYDREMSKPFAQPLKKQAWRLFQNDSSGYDIDSEIIVKQSIRDHWVTTISDVGDILINYKIRYIRRPCPIILEDLPNGLTIDGKSEASDCELNPILHVDILNKAVELALATRGRVQPQQQQQR